VNFSRVVSSQKCGKVLLKNPHRKSTQKFTADFGTKIHTFFHPLFHAVALALNFSTMGE